MEQTDTKNTNNKNEETHNTHANKPNDTKTGLYDNILDSISYFTLFGYILSRFAYELQNEK